MIRKGRKHIQRKLPLKCQQKSKANRGNEVLCASYPQQKANTKRSNAIRVEASYRYRALFHHEILILFRLFMQFAVSSKPVSPYVFSALVYVFLATLYADCMTKPTRFHSCGICIPNVDTGQVTTSLVILHRKLQPQEAVRVLFICVRR